MLKTVAGLVILVCVVFGIVYYTALGTPAPDTAAPVRSETSTETSTSSETETLPSDDAVIEYVRDNISELSPQKEVLGGTFFVTKITVDNGTGTVEYEDGHNAFTADFTYTKDSAGAPLISTFVLSH